jgi:sRNA-binding protein
MTDSTAQNQAPNHIKTARSYKPHARRSLSPDETAALDILLECWPDTFDLDEPVPLQLGIYEEISSAEPALAGPELDAVLSWYVRRIPYVLALAGGGKRAALDGKTAGDVSAQHQASASRAVINLNLRGRWLRADWPNAAMKGVHDE